MSAFNPEENQQIEKSVELKIVELCQRYDENLTTVLSQTSHIMNGILADEIESAVYELVSNIENVIDSYNDVSCEMLDRVDLKKGVTQWMRFSEQSEQLQYQELYKLIGFEPFQIANNEDRVREAVTFLIELTSDEVESQNDIISYIRDTFDQVIEQDEMDIIIDGMIALDVKPSISHNDRIADAIGKVLIRSTPEIHDTYKKTIRESKESGLSFSVQAIPDDTDEVEWNDDIQALTLFEIDSAEGQYRAYAIDIQRVRQSIQHEIGSDISEYFNRQYSEFGSTRAYINFDNTLHEIGNSTGINSSQPEVIVNSPFKSKSLRDGALFGLAVCDKLLATPYDDTAVAIDILDPYVQRYLKNIQSNDGVPAKTLSLLQKSGNILYKNNLASVSEADAELINAQIDPFLDLNQAICEHLYNDYRYIELTDGNSVQQQDIANYQQGFGIIRFAYNYYRLSMDNQFTATLERTESK